MNWDEAIEMAEKLEKEYRERSAALGKEAVALHGAAEGLQHFRAAMLREKAQEEATLPSEPEEPTPAEEDSNEGK